MSIVPSSATAEADPLVPAKSGGVEVQAVQASPAETAGSSPYTVEAPKYSSPKIYLDPRLHEVFYEIRDPQTGKQQYTIPSQASAKAYEATQSATGQNEAGHTGTDSQNAAFGQTPQPALAGQPGSSDAGSAATPNGATEAVVGAVASAPAAPVTTPSAAPAPSNSSAPALVGPSTAGSGASSTFA